MKQMLYLLIIIAMVSVKCKGDDKEKMPKDPETAVKALSLKGVQVISKANAIAMIKHALDSSLTKRDYSLGAISKSDMKLISALPGFRRFIIARANDLTTNEPLTIGAIFFAPNEEATIDQGQLVFTVITVCPPPDASTCLNSQLKIEF